MCRPQSPNPVPKVAGTFHVPSAVAYLAEFRLAAQAKAKIAFERKDRRCPA